MTDKYENSLEDIFRKYPALEKEFRDHARGIETAHRDITKLENKVKHLENDISNLRRTSK